MLLFKKDTMDPSSEIVAVDAWAPVPGQSSSIDISNACDRRFFDVRESMYMDCVKKYKREEAEIFPEMLSLVAVALEINP